MVCFLLRRFISFGCRFTTSPPPASLHLAAAACFISFQKHSPPLSPGTRAHKKRKKMSLHCGACTKRRPKSLSPLSGLRAHPSLSWGVFRVYFTSLADSISRRKRKFGRKKVIKDREKRYTHMSSADGNMGKTAQKILRQRSLPLNCKKGIRPTP